MLLNEMEIFYQVVEQQSFSKAADRLGVSKSYISKKITKLENHLKIRLITRSTRKLILTEAGKSFYIYCTKVVEEGKKGLSMLDELQGKPSGLLKISMPPALAMNLIKPMLSKYLERYPTVTLDVELESHLTDLVKEGYDLALRSAKLESSNLISQRIYTIENVICASKSYIEHRGQPIKPEDLQQHNCAVYSKSKTLGQITLQQGEHTKNIKVTGSFMSNHLDLIKQLILSNTCIGFLPKFMVIEEIKKGQLIECITDYKLPSNNLYVIYPEREFMLPKVSCFIELLKSHLADQA